MGEEHCGMFVYLVLATPISTERMFSNAGQIRHRLCVLFPEKANSKTSLEGTLHIDNYVVFHISA
jgi:hypothetical protein